MRAPPQLPPNILHPVESQQPTPPNLKIPRDYSPLEALQILRSVLNAIAQFPERRGPRGLSSSGRRVLIALATLTFGWQRRGDRVGMTQLMHTTGISKQSVSSALRELEALQILITSSARSGRGSIPSRRLDTDALFAAAGYSEKVKTVFTLSEKEGSTHSRQNAAEGSTHSRQNAAKGKHCLDTPLKFPSVEETTVECPRFSRGKSRLSETDLAHFQDEWNKEWKRTTYNRSRLDYTWNPRKIAALKSIVVELSGANRENHFQKLARAFFEDDDPYLNRNGYEITLLQNRVSKYLSDISATGVSIAFVGS